MNRVEATIFAASEPVARETLARIVGKNCSIDLLIDDIREELRSCAAVPMTWSPSQAVFGT